MATYLAFWPISRKLSPRYWGACRLARISAATGWIIAGFLE